MRAVIMCTTKPAGQNQGRNMEAVATGLKKEYRNGEATIQDFVPKKESTLMGRLDAKVKEPITLSKGTLALIAAFFVLLQVVFNYGGSFVGWTREDQSQREKMTSIQGQLDAQQKSIEAVNGKLDELQKTLTKQAIDDAKATGYKLGLADAHSSK